MRFLFLRLTALIFTLAWMSEAAATVCQPQKFTMNLNSRVSIRAANFPAIASQGTLVFIQGPEASYKSSSQLIENFCRHGFSVYAFDLKSSGSKSGKITESDYMKSTEKIVIRIKRTKPNLPILVYGWSKGARTASRYAQKNHKLVKRLILESPKFDSQSLKHFSNYPAYRTRIFACTKKDLPHRALVLVPAHKMKCGGHLTAHPETITPLTDFIESDFAGVNTESWFWKKI
jgi:alpha-beta hydrolase superfamily lysophospholipase